MLPNLKDLQVLVVDCQTTGGKASQSHLVEIGWMAVRPGDPAAFGSMTPTTYIVQQPEGVDPPKHIQGLTGLKRQHFTNAIEPQDAWRALRAQAKAVASSNRLPLCPVVIHFARFEMTFLRRLHAAEVPDTLFPLEVFCSHQMAARLWPQLPRKGLRAMAGYLGHSVSPLKRCGPHLEATATIWRHLVGKLGREYGIASLDELRTLMKGGVKAAPVARTYPMPRSTLLSAPARPGIDRFRRSNHDLLYIGKATSLKTRINSYFQAGRRHSESTLEMLTQAVKLDISTTSTALEAALLESDEIKRLQPPYNTALSSGRRKLHFLSRDFKHQASQSDDRCPLGPVPSPDLFAALHAIGHALASDTRDRESIDIGRLLCMPKRYVPEADCFQRGMDLFQAEFREALSRDDPWRALIRIGRRCWQEKIARSDDSTDSDDPSEKVDPETSRPEPFAWTPEAVSKTITSILRRCGFLLRRSRWLTMLSESTIAWQARGEPSGERRLLVFQAGGIIYRRCSTDAESLPAPPGGQLSPRARHVNLDLPTYDRLRVLTTELRRLVAEGRLVTIRLNRRTTMNNTQLSQLFRWI